MFDAIPQIVEEIDTWTRMGYQSPMMDDSKVALMWAHDEITQLREDLSGSTGAVLSLTHELAQAEENLTRALHLAIKLHGELLTLQRINEFVEQITNEKADDYEWVTP